MTDYSAILESETDPGAASKSSLWKRWAKNWIAGFEGAVGAPRLQDAALDSTVTAAGTTWVNARIAAAAVGAVGTYAYLTSSSTGVAFASGSTYAGSALRYGGSNTDSAGGSGTPSGTWRAMGFTNNPGSNRSSTLFLRIA